MNTFKKNSRTSKTGKPSFSTKKSGKPTPKNKSKLVEKKKAKPLKPKDDPRVDNLESNPEAAFNWFPGHMLKAMRDIKSKVAMVDLVIEIRDARVPLVSGNKTLSDSFKGKSRLILLNKANLADPAMIKEWSLWFEKQGEPYLYINCLDKGSMKKVLPFARKIIEEKRRVSNPGKTDTKKTMKFMITGLPNTGKSTFINQMANRHATKTADKPGETRVLIWVNVDEEVQILDTPGIMPPEISSEEHRIWLSIINAIPDDIIGVEDPACYLVKYLLDKKVPEFKERYQLENFNLTLDEVISKIAVLRGCLKPKGLPDLDRVYKLILSDFRLGFVGKTCFGQP